MIKRLKIRNFKSIRELDLELDPVTVLVGRSGTGKSNIVQALRFLRNCLLDLNQAVTFEGGWARIFPVGSDKPSVLVEVAFSIPDELEEYSYAVTFGAFAPEAAQISRETLSLGSSVLYSRFRQQNGQWKWDRAPLVEPQPALSDGPILGNVPSLQETVFAYAALSLGIGCYQFPSSVFLSVVQPPPFLLNQQGLQDTAGNYRDIMRRMTQDFHHPEVRKGLLASLQEINPSLKSVELDSLTNPQAVVAGHKIGDRVLALSLEQESDGFRRFYAHLLALYQTPAKLTLIFEEPENAIFPGALSLLAEEFKAAPREKRGQVILTTHSPSLLDSFDVDSVRVVDMKDGATVVGRVSREQREAVKDKLLKTGELLTVETPRLDEPAALEPA